MCDIDVKNFQWKDALHLLSHQKNRFYHTKGKRPSVPPYTAGLDMMMDANAIITLLEKRPEKIFRL